MSDWQKDKRWSDKFIPEIKRNLGEFLIGEPEPEEDAERNTDLIILKLDSVRIASRIRTFKFFEMAKNEFTVRSKRPSGVKTELAKIIEGWGDYFFYGFASESESGLYAWRILSLNVFRLWFNRELCGLDKYKTPGVVKTNADKSSSFHVFNILKIPNIIKARSAL